MHTGSLYSAFLYSTLADLGSLEARFACSEIKRVPDLQISQKNAALENILHGLTLLNVKKHFQFYCQVNFVSLATIRNKKFHCCFSYHSNQNLSLHLSQYLA